MKFKDLVVLLCIEHIKDEFISSATVKCSIFNAVIHNGLNYKTL